MTAVCEGGLAVNPINLLTQGARLPGRRGGLHGTNEGEGKAE